MEQPYGAWAVQSPAEMRARDAPPPRVRVVCFPSAGSGACLFHGWGAVLPQWAEVLPVELPGRNTRIHERMPVRYAGAPSTFIVHHLNARSPNPTQTEFDALIRDLVRDLAPTLCSGGVPYALVGHSFGAWVAYELARALPAPPLALYVCANRAPHFAGPEHDIDPQGASLAALCDHPEAFWRRFEARYGRNPDLQSAAVRRFIMPTLRADFTCLESYRGPQAGAAPLACPLTATGARGDARYTPQQVRAWARHTTGRFAERWEAPPPHAWATPHRFIADAPERFQAFLAQDLQALLDAAQAAPAEQASQSRSGAAA